jgi:Tfp pilus assembly protein PilN
MRAVNLLPQDEARRSSSGSRLPLIAVAGGAVAVTAFAAMTFVSSGSEMSSLRSEVAALEAEIASIPKGPAPAVAPAVLQLERTNRLAALSAAVTGRIAFDRLMHEVSLVLPSDVWLTGITAAAPSPTPPTGATAGAAPGATDVERGVTIEGATYSHEAVARVLARFAAMPSLTNVQLTATALVEPQQAATPTGSGEQPKKTAPKQRQKHVVTFTILASVQPGGAS